MKHTFIFIEIKVWTFFLSLMVCQNIVGKGSNSSSSSKQKSHIKFEEFQFGWKKKKNSISSEQCNIHYHVAWLRERKIITEVGQITQLKDQFQEKELDRHKAK